MSPVDLVLPTGMWHLIALHTGNRAGEFRLVKQWVMDFKIKQEVRRRL